MKTWNLVVGATALGVVVGVVTVLGEFAVSYESSYRLTPVRETSPPSTIQEKNPRSKVVVIGGETHDFGVMDRRSKLSHAFVFQNEGSGPLFVKTKSTTCKCTVSRLEETMVPPGDGTDVVLEWTPDGASENFQQRAEIQTNDPLRPIVDLTIRGLVVETFRTVPSQVVLRRVASDSSHSVRLVVYTYGDKEFEIVDYELADPNSTEFISAKIEGEATADELDDDPHATGAQAVSVTVKSGLPLGAVNHRLRLKTNIEDVPMIEVPIVGTVVSDISVIGSRFRSDQNRLRLGGVKATEGAKHELFIFVKGPHRDDVDLRVTAVDPPDILQVSIGQRSKLNQGVVHKYPLTIEIAPGSRAVSRLGTPGSPPGEILIETNHPHAKQLPIYVEFAIQG